jgi:hypothetical protein
MQTKFTKSTDSKHKVTLESKLIYAVWKASEAPQGQDIWYDIGFAFVGEGSPAKIRLKKGNGSTITTLEETVRRNRLCKLIRIPADLELNELVYFEVELSKNGLTGESNRIPVVPPIGVDDMQWSAAEARRGDILTLSATVRNANEEAPAIVTICEYDEDGAHDKITAIETKVNKKKIKLLWEYEYHEDTDEIPTQEEMERYGSNYNPPEYFFTIEIAGQKFGEAQESGLLKFKDYIEIQANEPDGTAIANEEVKVTLPDGSEKQGKTDANGYCKVEGIPPGRCKIEFPNRPGVRSVEQ